MRRREFIALLGGITCPSILARAQQAAKVYRVGLIFSDGPISWLTESPYAKAFVRALADLGYVEGQNLALERRTAEGKVVERTAEIVEDLVHRKVDAIVVGTTRLAREMKRATTTVPIVMAASVDPVAMGVVPNLVRPGGNITGFSAQAGPEIDAKRLQFLKEAKPNISNVAFLGTRLDWENTTNAKALREAAQALGIRLFLAEHTFTDYAGAFAVMVKERPDALFVAIQPASAAHAREIFDFVLEHRIPATYPWREFVILGGLMSYGTSVSDLYRRAAGYVDQILKGAKAGDLPVQQPTKFELVINLRAAKAVGLELSPLVVGQADELIE